MACGLFRTSLRSLRVPSAALPAAWACLQAAPVVNSRVYCHDIVSAVGNAGLGQWPAALPVLFRVSASSAVPALKPAVYHIEVVTGDVRGAGTQVSLQCAS